jgi:hypothetical protein
MKSEDSSFIVLIGVDCKMYEKNGYPPPVNNIVLGVGSYRIKAIYSGDENWSPAESGWYEFSVIPDPNAPSVTPPPPLDPPPVVNPPDIPPSDSSPTPVAPPAATPPVADPAPITKATPTADSTVAAGSTKASKLTAALAVPTVDFALNPVGGIYPTGNVTFTLQKKSGSKWKALGKKAVNLSKGKAKCKLTKATDAATYRVQANYAGDSNYNAITTKWTTIKIKKASGTTKKAIKVYSKAGKGKKLTTLKKGKKVIITGKSGKYFKVSLKVKEKTKTGYIAQKSVKVKKK